ncbi:MAG: histidine ammonia-lyase [Phycisphaerales bacterium JB037]
MAELPSGVSLDGSSLSIAQVEQVARGGVRVSITGAADARLRASRAIVEDALTDGEAHYGINTGFGSLSRQRIAAGELAALQSNLVRSHAAGVGEPLERDATRAMMLLLAGSLCRGASGVRPEVPVLLADLLNAGITPVVPALGSVGASGDLAPLAHLALVLIGEGEAELGGRVLPGGEALARAGLTPLSLQAKEGLALINGTHLMAARAALACADADRLFEAALLACAMSIDGCRGTDSFLDPRVHELRNQAGPATVAARLRSHLAGSEIIESHAENDPRVQDPYSLRCAPPVMGGALDCLCYVKHAVEAELGGVTDNPLVFEAEPRIVSAGNFHGMPLAIPLDALAIALSHLAGIAERRVFWMLSGRDPESGLRPYLASQPGLQSGLMIAQYTAAALCNEIITLATPASVSNIPTSAGMEDYNSFGPRSAAKAARAIELSRRVVAIELLCAAEAIENHRPLRSGRAVERAHELVREVVPPLDHDRPPSPDIEQIAERIKRGDFGGLG